MTHSRIGLLVILALVLLVAPLAAEAQPPAKIPQVGFLRHGRRADAPFQRRLDEFWQQTWPQPPLHPCGPKPTVAAPQVYDAWRDD